MSTCQNLLNKNSKKHVLGRERIHVYYFLRKKKKDHVTYLCTLNTNNQLICVFFNHRIPVFINFFGET